MERLFNKTFFKFTIGFVVIVAIALLAIMITGAFEFEGSTELPIESQQLIAE